MKKIKNIEKYKKDQLKKAKKEARKRATYKLWRKIKNKREQGIPKPVLSQIHVSQAERWQYNHEVHAPVLFSFTENTEEVVAFIHTLDNHCQKRERVYVDLLHVESIDYGAIVAMLSIMVKFKAANIKFKGNFPRNTKCKEMLIESGFFENMWKKFKDEDRYYISKEKAHGIHTHAWKRVDPELSANLIHSAAKTVWGEERRCQGIQRALLELMQNTNNHAEIGKKGEKHWWLSVNEQKEKNMACFAFVDFGVGIFKNLENKPDSSKFANWGNKIANRFRYGDNADLLKLILNGDFHRTVTGKHYRGKGLPGIAEAQKRNQMENLRIVTNDVFCWYDRVEYKKLKNSFNGTFVYWELNKNNESFK